MFDRWFRRNRERTSPIESAGLTIDSQRIPQHIAIIMDGNGRWAQKRGLPRTLGHRAGVEALRETVKFCAELGVKVLTVYAFSTENWKRPSNEIDTLMDLLIEYLQKEIDNLYQQQVQIRFIGDIGGLARNVQREIRQAQMRTNANQGLTLNIAVNYGGRAEIMQALRRVQQDLKAGKIETDEIDESCFSRYLFTGDLVDPDLLIRPSGDYRISNFLLWQLAYTEFWFSDVLWPDFSREHLLQAIHDYQKRDRRFGGLNKKI